LASDSGRKERKTLSGGGNTIKHNGEDGRAPICEGRALQTPLSGGNGQEGMTNLSGVEGSPRGRMWRKIMPRCKIYRRAHLLPCQIENQLANQEGESHNLQLGTKKARCLIKKRKK